MKAAISPGMIFAGYRVEELVGRGGMGVVYRATDLSLERPVALKLVAPELAEDERFRERFLREPRLAASLDHPHVIPIYEAGEHDGQLYLAMRFVEGSDLRTILEREEKLSPERTLAVLAQVADALDAAHRRALVHRDVKPANVLLDEDGHAYLTDFGITKQVGGDSTDTGRVVGTLDYLAPEQIRGDPVDGRADVYALGCLLYECLAGVPPFRRDTEAETLWAHMQEAPPPLRDHRGLDPVLRKALAKNQEDRYGSGAELIDAAADALGLARAPRAAGRSHRAPGRSQARPRHPRRRPVAAGRDHRAGHRGPDRRRGREGRADRQRRGRDRPRGRERDVVHGVGGASRQRRGGRGGRLGARQRGQDRLPDRSGHEGGDRDLRHPRRAERARRRRGRSLGRHRRRARRHERNRQRRPDGSRRRPSHRNGEAPRRRGGLPGWGDAAARGRRGCGLGRQPGRKRVPHRTEERATRGDDRDERGRGRSPPATRASGSWGTVQRA